MGWALKGVMATPSPHKALTSLQGLRKAHIGVRKVFFMACKALTAIHGLKCFLHGLSSCRGLHSLPGLPILSKFLMAYKAFEGLPQPQGLSGFLRASLCLFFPYILANVCCILLSRIISLQFLDNLLLCLFSVYFFDVPSRVNNMPMLHIHRIRSSNFLLKLL